MTNQQSTIHFSTARCRWHTAQRGKVCKIEESLPRLNCLILCMINDMRSIKPPTQKHNAPMWLLDTALPQEHEIWIKHWRGDAIIIAANASPILWACRRLTSILFCCDPATVARRDSYIHFILYASIDGAATISFLHWTGFSKQTHTYLTNGYNNIIIIISISSNSNISIKNAYRIERMLDVSWLVSGSLRRLAVVFTIINVRTSCKQIVVEKQWARSVTSSCRRPFGPWTVWALCAPCCMLYGALVTAQRASCHNNNTMKNSNYYYRYCSNGGAGSI